MANAAANERRDVEVSVTLDGTPCSQPVYRYQAKCYGRLRQAFAALDDGSRGDSGDVLPRRGCLRYLG